MNTNTNHHLDIFHTLCFKYRKVLTTEDVWHIDSLLSAFWSDHSKQDSQVDEVQISRVSEPSVPGNNSKLASLLEELEHVYDQLEEIGMSKNEIREKIFDRHPISRLFVNRRREVIFPDYSKVIRLTPVQFAIYVLFLNHPCGLELKDIHMYRSEITEILKPYIKNPLRLERTVCNIIDTTKGSIHENISRIRHSIIEAVGTSKALHYYINGTRKGKYVIPICRDFVEFLM